jgi:hypothetical protein
MKGQIFNNFYISVDMRANPRIWSFLSILRPLLFLKDPLELHSLKTSNLEVLPYFCCVQKILKEFVSFHLHGGLMKVY